MAFLNNLSVPYKLLAFLFTLSLLVIAFFGVTQSIERTVLVTVFVLAFIFLTKAIWISPEQGKLQIRQWSLAIVLIVASSVTWWEPLVLHGLQHVVDSPWIQTQLPFLQGFKVPTPASPVLVFIFVLIGVYIVNYFMRDTTAMKAHSEPLDKAFPEKNFKQRLNAFCGVLKDDLNKLDRETNWSAEYFTPLDAEVELQRTGGRRLKKVTDLLSAIKSDRQSRTFLVIGEPGSGKSVALRKLCRDLLGEVERTGKVPVYINLREWAMESAWTAENPPTVAQLYDFVLNNLKDRGDIYTSEFLDAYFKPMLDHGRLFLVLDSFDEIPAVLDENESSWLIDALSAVMYGFLAGAHDSRGILASRIFRRPTGHFAAEARLEIRPFSEMKIAQALQNTLGGSEAVVQQLFNERPELVPVARNPFSAALIASYVKTHDYQLPPNQAALYASYIQQRLVACADKIRKVNLKNEKARQRFAQQGLPAVPVTTLSESYILACVTDIADLMFSRLQSGLEVAVEELAWYLPDYPVEDIVDVLVFSRLGRLGSGDERRFSFAHRRFNEYFVVQRLIEQPERVPTEAIPTDSRWRDALVLYCEVADDREAKRIAQYCWAQIRKVIHQQVQMDDPQFLRALHALRFLNEAFRGRLEAIESFRHKLAGFIDRQVSERQNLLLIKFAVESVGLLPAKTMDSVLVKALEIRSDWISEVAIRSCRNLSGLSKKLNEELEWYIDWLDTKQLITRKNEFLFVFKLSDTFDRLYKFYMAKIVDFVIFLIGILSHLFIAILGFFPISGLFAYIALFFIFIFYYYKNQVVFDIVYGIRYFNVSFAFILPFNYYFFSSINNGFEVYNIVNNYLYSLITILFFIQWFKIFHVLSYSSYIIKQSIIELLHRVGVILIFFTIYIIVYLYIDFLNYLLEKITYIVIAVKMVVYLLFAIILPYLVIKNFREIWHDNKIIYQQKKKTDFTREQIATVFNKLKTERGRLKFIKHLEQRAIKLTGQWPNGKLPNINNDQASTGLAQLEERWLGLDR